MKKKFMFLFSATLAVVAAHAETYPYLTFQKMDGSTVSIGVESLTMTFSDGKLIATNGSESQELTASDLASMYFSSRIRQALKTL